MAQSSKSRLSFPTATGLPLDAAFDAGRLTSDGGLPWLSEADHALALCETLAACIPDWRQRRGQHDVVTLVRQRVYQIACGYADQDDATTLRHDPLFKLACGRLPASGAPLASQPTFSRLENAIDRHTNERLAAALVARYLQRRGQDGVPTQILLDLDGTDDPVHGQQEGGAYHGYYRQPLRRAGAASVAAGAAGGLALSGFWQMPIIFLSRSLAFFRAPLLRSGTDGTAAKVIAIPDHLLRWPCACALTAALPRRASIAGAEQAGVGYTIGLIPNPTLERAAADLLAAAQAQSAEQGGAKVRLAGETVYQRGVGRAPAAWSIKPKSCRRDRTPASWSPPTPPACRWTSMTRRSSGGRQRTSARTLNGRCWPTDYPTTASGLTSSACCCMRPPTPCCTPCATGLLVPKLLAISSTPCGCGC